jgi:hypothetical protein
VLVLNNHPARADGSELVTRGASRGRHGVAEYGGKGVQGDDGFVGIGSGGTKSVARRLGERRCLGGAGVHTRGIVVERGGEDRGVGVSGSAGSSRSGSGGGSGGGGGSNNITSSVSIRYSARILCRLCPGADTRSLFSST